MLTSFGASELHDLIRTLEIISPGESHLPTKSDAVGVHANRLSGLRLNMNTDKHSATQVEVDADRVSHSGACGFNVGLTWLTRCCLTFTKTSLWVLRRSPTEIQEREITIDWQC